MARMFLVYPALLLLIAAAALTADDRLTDEECTVYSAALRAIQFSHSDKNDMLVIVRDTSDPQNLQALSGDCSKLSTDLRHRMEDVLNANRRSSVFTSKTLEEKRLSIGRRYVLVSAEEGDRWQLNRFQPRIPTDPPVEEYSDPFPTASDLIRFSNILFNGNKTLALVYISARCGTLCGLSSWYFLEKIQGVWRVETSPVCGTISYFVLGHKGKQS